MTNQTDMTPEADNELPPELRHLARPECARSACHALHMWQRHRDTDRLYCRRCARMINEACGEELVLDEWSSRPTDGADGAGPQA